MINFIFLLWIIRLCLLFFPLANQSIIPCEIFSAVYPGKNSTQSEMSLNIGLGVTKVGLNATKACLTEALDDSFVS